MTTGWRASPLTRRRRRGRGGSQRTHPRLSRHAARGIRNAVAGVQRLVNSALHRSELCLHWILCVSAGLLTDDWCSSHRSLRPSRRRRR